MQVLGNLLSNALRYVPAGSHVLVRTQPRDQDVVISVLDDGPGVLPDHLSHLFERFWRMDQSRQRASGGSGLGLSIAAEIVEAQGGRIWAEETPVVGSPSASLSPRQGQSCEDMAEELAPSAGRTVELCVSRVARLRSLSSRCCLFRNETGGQIILYCIQLIYWFS